MLRPNQWRLVAAVVCGGSFMSLGCTGRIGNSQSTPGGSPATPPGGGVDPGPSSPGGPSPGVGAPIAPDAPRICGADQIGPSPLHRLTKVEYDATIDDLFGETMNLAKDFSADELAGTFTGNTFTPLTEMQFSQYATGASAAAEKAVTMLTRLVPCTPAGDGVACATQFIKQFGRRAYRRPVDNAELDRFLKLFDVGRTGTGVGANGFANGVRLVVQAMLQSPHFVYLVEGPGALTQHQMAARLSYFLWNGPPDAELSAAADSGKLGTIAGLREQTKRLLADKRALAVIAEFHNQWLGLTRLPKLQKDATLYKEWDGLREAIIEESGRFVAEVMTADGGRLETLLTAPFSVTNGPLATLYGAKGGAADQWGKVALDARQRAGFLAAHGALDGSSPIRRGLAVRERLLCSEMPQPPPGADANVPPLTPSTTTRQRFDKHRADPSCAACHALMDKLGYGFESYDGIGRFRTTENGVNVDDSGEVLGTDVDGPFKGAAELAKKLASSKEVHHCVTEQWFRYAFARLNGDADSCVMNALVDRFAAADFRISDLLLAIVESDAFRTYRPLN
jgi:Protein of unknown function (DUF1592)/Protein of unknown function (DUF1588)/Protein of unknown function (DUF1595)/Protein of unknown function (DUF1585)/Protein of unknown function (DUF1587)